MLWTPMRDDDTVSRSLVDWSMPVTIVLNQAHWSFSFFASTSFGLGGSCQRGSSNLTAGASSSSPAIFQGGERSLAVWAGRARESESVFSVREG